MSMEMQEMDGRPSTPIRTSSLSAAATTVNSPDKPEFPPSVVQSDCRTSGSSSLSSDSDDDDDDDDEGEINRLPKDFIQGWPQLAQLMAKTPDFAAFPRFRDLNVKSLLYYQCELNSLREELHKLEYADKASGKDYAEYANELMEDGMKSKQFEKITEIRKVLKEYNEALLQYSKICALPDPEPFNMRTLRKWIRHKRYGDHKIRDQNGPVNTWGVLRDNPDDEEKSLWSQFGSLVWGLLWMRRPAKSESDPDLALTEPQTQVDGLTHWYASELIPFRRALKKKRKPKTPAGDIEKNAEKNPGRNLTGLAPWATKVKKEETLVSWSENSALRLTSGISTVVACLLPVIAISVLSQLQGLKALLICLAGFSLIFAVGLIALTQGTSKRTEIFGATAAFSAVMVVFISIPPAPVIMMPPGSAMPSVSPSPVVSMLP